MRAPSERFLLPTSGEACRDISPLAGAGSGSTENAMGEARRLFFSYARSDAGFAVRLASDLRKAGQSVWVDQLDIPKGARWDEEVETALKACPCFLIVLTPDSANSENVRDEVSYALGENKTILPILLTECSIPFRLRRLQYVDFTGDYDQAFRELVDALHRLEPTAQPQPGTARPAQGLADKTAKSSRTTGQVREIGPGDSGVAAMATPAGGRATSRRLLVPVALVIVAVVAGAFYAFSPLSEDRGQEPSTRALPEPEAPPQPEAPLPRAAPRAAAEPAAPEPSATEPPPRASMSIPEPRRITADEATAFVDRLLATVNRGSPSELLGLYADRVDYFDRGVVGKDYILQDKRAYFRRWPEVENRLVGKVALEPTEMGDTATVWFAIAYRVHSPERGDTKSGTAENELQVRRVGDELKIVAEKQRVFRN